MDYSLSLRLSVALLLTFGMIGFHRTTTAEVLVRFDQEEYVVFHPGDAFTADIIIVDLDNGTANESGIDGGLSSFGTQATFDAAKAKVDSTSDIVTVADLSFFGLAGGAFEQVGPGLAATKGNIDPNVFPQVPYGGLLLATITFENLASGPTVYPLALDFFNTLGPTEQIFVNGNGVSLDGVITFAPSRVRVVPEPSGILPFLVFVVGFAGRRRLRSRSGRLASQT